MNRTGRVQSWGTTEQMAGRRGGDGRQEKGEGEKEEESTVGG